MGAQRESSFFRSPVRSDFFLRQAIPQCRCNNTVKLVKSTSAFAGAENVRIVVDDFLLVSRKAVEYFFAFYHADLALESHCRFYAPDPVTLPEDDWGHDFLHFLANSVAILAITADVGKVF